MTWFLLQFGVISTCKFFKDYKLHLPYGFVQFCCLWKIYSCLAPSCKRNHVITYTNHTSTGNFRTNCAILIRQENTPKDSVFGFSQFRRSTVLSNFVARKKFHRRSEKKKTTLLYNSSNWPLCALNDDTLHFPLYSGFPMSSWWSELRNCTWRGVKPEIWTKQANGATVGKDVVCK